MIRHTVKKLPKNTYSISLEIPWENVSEEYKKAFTQLQKALAVEGFRAGKVPTDIAEKHIMKEKVYQQAIQSLLSAAYDEILRAEGLKPVASPKIELLKAKEKEDWQAQITIAEKPEIKLGDYKKTVKDAKLKMKEPDIWVPGKDKSAQKADPEADKQRALNEALSSLIKSVSCEISDLILEEELNQRLARLVDDVQKIGLTTETYLKSKNLTIDKLKDQYRREIEEMYKLEYVLTEIADREEIKVEPQEIETLLANIKDERERANARSNAYFYAGILRKQKVLDFLSSL